MDALPLTEEQELLGRELIDKPAVLLPARTASPALQILYRANLFPSLVLKSVPAPVLVLLWLHDV